MIPVDQTKPGGADLPAAERGDCFAACVASILEVPITEVVIPHSDDPDFNWWGVAQKAVVRHGFYLVYADVEFYPQLHWIAGVVSLEHPADGPGVVVPHVIVMEGDKVAHDPAIGKRYEVGTPRGELHLTDAFVLVPLKTRSTMAMAIRAAA